MNRVIRCWFLLLMASISAGAFAGPNPLPAPASTEFCQVVQKIMATTSVESDNTLFENMADYRHSKPKVDPLQTYQVVTYDGQKPIMVSCKVKGAAHLRSAFGPDAAGEQVYCPSLTRLIKAQAIEALKSENRLIAVGTAESFIVDENEPFITGRSYLSEFELSFADEDGMIHLNSLGLFQDYDSWVTVILPENYQGQVYCHLPTVDYIKALALGELQPGTKITTEDDAPTMPH
jgi:hypothetical protein